MRMVFDSYARLQLPSRRSESLPKLGEVFDDAHLDVNLVDEETRLDLDEIALGACDADDLRDLMQRICQRAPHDVVLVLHESVIEVVHVFPEGGRRGDVAQHCGEEEGAAATEEIGREIVLRVAQLMVPRLEVLAHLFVTGNKHGNIAIRRTHRDQVADSLEHRLLHPLVATSHHPSSPTRLGTTRRPCA